PCCVCELRSPLRTPFLPPAPAPAETCTLSLHDALPIWHWAQHASVHGRTRAALIAVSTLRPECLPAAALPRPVPARRPGWAGPRSEEHTSELQSRFDLVCRLLLEKKKESMRANRR